MTAQADFVSRLKYFNRTLGIDAVQTKALTDRDHNECSRLLRNGLAVVGFNALEDFIKKRTSEVLAEIGSTPVPFSRLPEGIQSATTYNSIRALAFQLGIRDAPDKMTYIQEQARRIASTASAPYELIEHAFGYDASNVGEKTVSSILNAFLIDRPWEQITAVSASMTFTALPLRDSFESASKRRHTAAHVATSNVAANDLVAYVKEAYGIALGFDALLSTALRRVKRIDHGYLSGQSKLTARDVKFRVISFNGRVWRETVQAQNGRAVRTAQTSDTLVPNALDRAQRAGETLVILAEDGLPSRWMH